MMDVDKLLQKLFFKRRFQTLAFICLGFIYGRSAWIVFGILFLASDVNHTCRTSNIYIPDLRPVKEHSPYQNLSTIFTVSTDSRQDDEKQSNVLVSYSECYVTLSDKNGSSNNTELCTSGWVYSKAEFESTIVSEWDLVCSQAYLSGLSTTLFMVGSMIGAILITPLADKFGRRLILLLCLLAQAVVGICVTLSPNYVVFTTLRFIVGFFNMAISLSAYVMLTEIFPAQFRTMPCCGFQIFWAFGIMMTAFFGFMIRNWRHLQLILSLPNLLLAVFVWFLPESLPWLISQNQLSKAQSVVERITKFNGIEPLKELHESEGNTDNYEGCSSSSDITYQNGGQALLLETSSQEEAVCLTKQFNSQQSQEIQCNKTNTVYIVTEETNDLSYTESHKQHADKDCRTPPKLQESSIIPVITEMPDNMVSFCSTSTVTSTVSNKRHDLKNGNSILALCSGSRIRLYSAVIFYLFFVNSLSYFGISLSTPVLHGNQFLNLFFLGAVEIPAYITCVFACNRFGRRIPLCLFLLLCGVANITAVLMPEEARGNWLRDAFVMIGKFAITGGYTVVYLYSAEIFPTSVRNHAIGISSFFENLGSVTAPFIVFSAKSVPELPLILFGVTSIIGAALLVIMPETHRKPMPQTIADVEKWELCNQQRQK